MAQFEVNDIDSKIGGVTFLEGVYDELTKPPVPKDTLVNDWADEHGKERDAANRVYKSRPLQLPIMIEGNSRADFLTKKQAFVALLLSGYFNLKCYDINRQFNLIYVDANDFKDYGTYCTMKLLVEDDYPHLNTPIA